MEKLTSFLSVHLGTSVFLDVLIRAAGSHQNPLFTPTIKYAVNFSISSPPSLTKTVQTGLKGQCHDIFRLRFFSHSNSIWALD
jgi:hypothetical protein